MILYKEYYKDWWYDDDDEWHEELKTTEILIENVVSCIVNQTETDFSLSLEIAGCNYLILIGGIICVDIGDSTWDFRINSIVYNSESDSMSVSAKYRGYDLNGIYPNPVRGHLTMHTPKSAIEQMFNWNIYGGYKASYLHWSDSEAFPYIDSEIRCNEESFLFPFYISTHKSATDIAYNDVAGAIGYMMRPCDVKHFEIIPKTKDIEFEFVSKVNIVSITQERSYTDKPAGIVAVYKNPNNAQFLAGASDLLPGRAQMWDASSEQTNPDITSDVVLWQDADARLYKVNPYKIGIDKTYTIVPTPSVQNVRVGDLVSIIAEEYYIYESPLSADYYDADTYNMRVKQYSYDCIEKCYTYILVGDKKSDYIDLMVSEMEETDNIESVKYEYLSIDYEQWSDDLTYSFNVSSASLIKFAEVEGVFDDIGNDITYLNLIKIVGFTGGATKTITLKASEKLFNYADEFVQVDIKLWKRG